MFLKLHSKHRREVRLIRRIVDAAEICDETTYVGLENIATGGNFVNVCTVASGELSSNKFVFTRDHILYGQAEAVPCEDRTARL